MYNMEVSKMDINSQNNPPYDEEVNLRELDGELKQQKQHQVKLTSTGLSLKSCSGS